MLAIVVVLGCTLLAIVAGLVTIPIWGMERVERAPPLASLWAQLMLGGGMALAGYRIALLTRWNPVAVAGALAVASFGLGLVAELDRPRPRTREIALVGAAVFLSAGAPLAFGAMKWPAATFFSGILAPLPPCVVRARRQRAVDGWTFYGWLLTWSALGMGGLAILLLGPVPEDAGAVLLGFAAALGLHGSGLGEGVSRRRALARRARVTAAALLIAGLVAAVLLFIIARR